MGQGHVWNLEPDMDGPLTLITLIEDKLPLTPRHGLPTSSQLSSHTEASAS